MQSLSDQQNCLLSILTCLLCQERASQAHICPNCSKFFCFICIKTWICEKSGQCPNCTENLEETQLVNCQKLCIDLSHALESMSAAKIKNVKKCQQHTLELNYYCKDCQIEVCSDCCVVSQEHREHQFLKKSEVKKEFEKQSRKLKLLINNAKQNTEKLIKYYKGTSTVLEVNLQKDNQKFSQFVRNLKERTTKKFNSEIRSIEKNIDIQRGLINEKNQVYDKSLKFIKDCSKVQFVVTQADQLQQKIASHIGQIKQSNKNLKDKLLEYDRNSLQSQIIPPFQSKTFSIQNFSNLCFSNEMIYTDVLHTNGLEWRLKIYPAGISNEQNLCQQNILPARDIKQCYMSVFVELKRSIRDKGKYRHKVVIENSKRKDKILEREFESEFDKGECWGYDKLIKIEKLYENGFIDEATEELRISLMIAPANYFEASEDIKALVQEKRHKLKEIQKVKEICLSKNEKLQARLQSEDKSSS